MSKNYTVFFILLFSFSIMGGYALKNSVEYAVTAGYGFGMVFMLAAVYFQTKKSVEKKNS
ncbi:hypothetical protein ACFFJY_14150 [Fictibacillus aquaticus]|uniref:Uncharacterized protein n=1 Tax=Fictibacillus aquaticus TaxID=2021314 RepID=A0A235FDD0_9BACL|nr:hypothetical protein [Fictibacillus aquaticus]OYD59358.1 hypothetical protein CGZ90_05570 [Fictibacillus aquaticus]